MNLKGSIDLLKLEKTAVMTINGNSGPKRCLVIPIDDNDIYISADQSTGKARSAYLSLNIYERKEPSKYGKTHYVKQSLSKNYREMADEELVKKKNDIYFGDFEQFTFEGSNQSASVSAPVAAVADLDDVPF